MTSQTEMDGVVVVQVDPVKAKFGAGTRCVSSIFIGTFLVAQRTA
jgi:hypothetical protein